MENTTIIETVLNKKIEGYRFEENNFKAASEIMVEITLKEYRDLVKSDATRSTEIEKANSDKYSREEENRALKEENAALKAELYEMKKRLESFVEEEKEAENENNS